MIATVIGSAALAVASVCSVGPSLFPSTVAAVFQRFVLVHSFLPALLEFLQQPFGSRLSFLAFLLLIANKAMSYEGSRQSPSAVAAKFTSTESGRAGGNENAAAAAQDEETGDMEASAFGRPYPSGRKRRRPTDTHRFQQNTGEPTDVPQPFAPVASMHRDGKSRDDHDDNDTGDRKLPAESVLSGASPLASQQSRQRVASRELRSTTSMSARESSSFGPFASAPAVYEPKDAPLPRSRREERSYRQADERYNDPSYSYRRDSHSQRGSLSAPESRGYRGGGRERDRGRDQDYEDRRYNYYQDDRRGAAPPRSPSASSYRGRSRSNSARYDDDYRRSDRDRDRRGRSRDHYDNYRQTDRYGSRHHRHYDYDDYRRDDRDRHDHDDDGRRRRYPRDKDDSRYSRGYTDRGRFDSSRYGPRGSDERDNRHYANEEPMDHYSASGSLGERQHGRTSGGRGGSGGRGNSKSEDDGWKSTSRSKNRRERFRKKKQGNNDDDDNDNDKGGRGPPPPPTIEYIPPNASNSTYTPFMLILVGVPGSGKSTFANSLVQGKPWMFVRINQDSLGNRRACEDLTRKTLAEGKCPIIDRCNFDVKQRKHFLDIAKEAGVPVDCLVFTFSLDVCIRRCQQRQDHETLSPQEAPRIVRMMMQNFSPPLPGRVNVESFRNLKTITDPSSFNDVVMDYLTML